MTTADRPDEQQEPVDAPVSDESLSDILAHNERLLAEFLARGDTDVPEIQQDLPAEHRSGYVAVVGKPNVGKSTLMNRFLGEKLAIVSPKPQTTRSNQLGILTRPDGQVVFVDTPGIHRAHNKLDEYMVDAAMETIPDADVVLFIVDVSELPGTADEMIAAVIGEKQVRQVFLALNKADLVSGEQGVAQAAAYRRLLPDAEPVMISATEGTNCAALLERIVLALPHGPRYFPDEQLTQTHVRDNVAEIIREQALLLYQHEIPHSLAVQVEQFGERGPDLTYIEATLYVERDSQKRILIGSGGAALKQLGRQARVELEQMLGTRVYLELWVKVLKNWRKDEQALKRLGYHRPRDAKSG
jgi:GTP-binding protein Era